MTNLFSVNCVRMLFEVWDDLVADLALAGHRGVVKEPDVAGQRTGFAELLAAVDALEHYERDR